MLLLTMCCRIAYTALEDHESGYECYRKALELDPGNQSYQNNLEIAEQKLQEVAANVCTRCHVPFKSGFVNCVDTFDFFYKLVQN